MDTRGHFRARKRKRKMDGEKLRVSRNIYDNETEGRVRVLYPPVRAAVSQHLAATCSGFLVKNSAPAGNVNVSLHIRRSRDFIHETLEAPAGECPPAMKYQKARPVARSDFRPCRRAVTGPLINFVNNGEQLKINVVVPFALPRICVLAGSFQLRLSADVSNAPVNIYTPRAGICSSRAYPNAFPPRKRGSSGKYSIISRLYAYLIRFSFRRLLFIPSRPRSEPK